MAGGGDQRLVYFLRAVQFVRPTGWLSFRRRRRRGARAYLDVWSGAVLGVSGGDVSQWADESRDDGSPRQ